MRFFRHIGLLILLVHVIPAQAQEEQYLDDTPQDVYNPTTTLFTTQEAIQYHLGGYKAIADDMGIFGMHRFTFVQQYGNKLQNLGNNGTAVKPIFYTLPEQIGATSGFHAYDIYFRNPHQFRYYDTKSPYTELYVVLARFGSAFADVCYTRNITPNWNVGGHFRRMMTHKEWIPAGSPDMHVMLPYGIDVFTHYKTADKRYQLLAHWLFMEHHVRETGGIYTEEYSSGASIVEQELFQNSIDNRLRDVKSSDQRNRFHLYHQLGLGEQLWAYHELGLQKQWHFFGADADKHWGHDESRTFLGGKPDDLDEALKATTTMWHAQHELGVKGDWQNLFYNGYYRYKDVGFKHEYEHEELEDKYPLHEHYVGLRTRYDLANRQSFLHLGGEYLLQGLYKACVGYQGNIFDLALERTRYQPSFLAQHYRGYHREWDNHGFTSPTATQLRGGWRLEGNVVQLRPNASFTRVEKHIYFKHLSDDKLKQRKTVVAIPRQDNQYADVVTLGTDFGLALGAYIHWDSEVTFAKVWGPSAQLFHVPTWLINSRLYYARTNEAGNGTIEAGIDVNWKSYYKADAYDPVIQQFYWQDEFNVYSYPVLDLFVNFRVKYLRMFFKFSHGNEHLFLPGYFVTPLYPGQKRALDIGFSWSFFD
ncbi:MAG: putative porin [Bacteroidota bacterium]